MSMMRGDFSLMRRMSTDPEIVQHRLTRGVVRRILAFARPYRGLIVGFITLVVISSALAVTPPLLFKQIIDEGVLGRDRSLVVRLGITVAALAVLQAVIGMVQRWCSSTIGEGLIFDLRTKVFDHVVQMPLAFFTRTQTGKLVSRLNSDVIGAQQAFTSTLSTVLSNLISLVLVLVAMLLLSWQLTLAALVMLPIFLIPAKIVGRKLADLTRKQMQLNGDMSSLMTERFSVSGALLVSLFGRLATEHDQFAARAGAVRDVSVKIAMNGRFFMTSLGLVAALATALVYGVGGTLAIDRRADRRHPDRPGRAAGPALRPAHPADQHAHRRDERAGQLRPGVRGARPEAGHPRPRGCGAGDRAALGEPSTTSASPTPARPRSRWPAWSPSPRSTSGPTPRCCTT